MSDPSLKGLRILVLRPAEQAGPLCRLLEEQGAQAVRLAMQAIEPVRQLAAAARTLQNRRDAVAWIFTSVNAVRYARQLDAGVWPHCIAVGAATAAALAQVGITAAVPAGEFSSEAVLALPQLQAVQNASVLVVTGEGGRQVLERTLRERGAHVERVEVYRRVRLPHAPEDVACALQDVDAVVATSGESLHLLVDCLPERERTRLLGLQLVVPSRRVVEQAGAMGFAATPLVPEQITDVGYLHCLEQWHRA